MLTVRTGEWDVLASGSYIAPLSGDTSFIIKSEREELTFVFELKTDKNEEEQQQFHIAVENEFKARFKLVNWNNVLGGGLTEPLHIGTFDDRELYVFFVIQKLGSQGEARLIIFNAYLGAEVENGQD